MLQPKRTKYRRPHKVSYEGPAKGGRKVDFGEWGLQACEGTYLTANQIEAARICLSRYTKRSGQIWIRVFPQLSRTKKPLQVRQGSGKGAPDHWVAVVKEGFVMFEIGGVDETMCVEALKRAAQKLPIKCRLVQKGKEEA